jgi:hypothetical protein
LIVDRIVAASTRDGTAPAELDQLFISLADIELKAMQPRAEAIG